jgi:hypothetical protein
MMSMPVHRSIIAVDIEHSTGPLRTNPVREELRQAIHALLTEAMCIAGIGEEHRDPFVDRGDGILGLVHPVDDVPKTRLLYPLIPALTGLLAARSSGLPEADRARRALRLRVVVHAGEVHLDGTSTFGEDVDLACRLLDAQQLKGCLKDTSAPLVLVVSEYIYREIVRHEYDGIAEASFRPRVRVSLAGRNHRGWVHIPPEAPAARVPAQRALADGNRLPPPPPSAAPTSG